MAKDVKIVPSSEIWVKGTGAAPFLIREVSNIEPVRIQYVQNIAPVAAHIKEVNHIDPISVEALHVNEVRNIEPINIERFNVTNLPTVNMSMRQVPPVDLNIRRLPAVSLGTHQDFQLPSSYTVRARFLGIEVFRIHLNGHTEIVPRERYRREQGKTHNRSFAVPETAGNPAIPSSCRVSCTTSSPQRPQWAPRSSPVSKAPGKALGVQENRGRPAKSGAQAGPVPFRGQPTRHSSLTVGMPNTHFSLRRENVTADYGETSVSIGE